MIAIDRDGDDLLGGSALAIDVVRNYRLWLNRLTDDKGASLKRMTQNYHVIALRAFLKYLSKRDIDTLPADKIELGKTEKRTVEFMAPEECRRLLEAAGNKNTFTSLRDRSILELSTPPASAYRNWPASTWSK